MAEQLPDLLAGVYRHYKGQLYLVLGYGDDSNQAGRRVVMYVGLQLEGAPDGPRIKVRTVEDFLAVVDPTTGDAVPELPSLTRPRRFTYLAPSLVR